MKKLLIVAIAILFVGGISSTAKAVSLVPGGDVTPAGTFTLPSDAGVLASITAVPVSGEDINNKVKFTGTLSETVYSDSTGTLFEYTFSNTGKTGDIREMSITGFAGFTTDVDATLAGVSPSSIERSSIGDDGGDVMDFYFKPISVTAGLSSDTLWIQTNAQSYTLNSTQLQDGGNSRTSTYGPATPEPATMLMFGMGALGLVGLRKRKVA